ncbi:Uncharacterised protein [Legionella taurinensis]|nr:Uncharacterised protein [Legionella taurinensis]
MLLIECPRNWERPYYFNVSAMLSGLFPEWSWS